MKTKAFVKGLAIGATIIFAAVMLSSCTTVTTTLPDGTVTTTKSTDPTTAGLIAQAVSDLAKTRIHAEK